MDVPPLDLSTSPSFLSFQFRTNVHTTGIPLYDLIPRFPEQYQEPLAPFFERLDLFTKSGYASVPSFAKLFGHEGDNAADVQYARNKGNVDSDASRYLFAYGVADILCWVLMDPPPPPHPRSTFAGDYLIESFTDRDSLLRGWNTWLGGKKDHNLKEIISKAEESLAPLLEGQSAANTSFVLPGNLDFRNLFDMLGAQMNDLAGRNTLANITSACLNLALVTSNDILTIPYGKVDQAAVLGIEKTRMPDNFLYAANLPIMTSIALTPAFLLSGMSLLERQRFMDMIMMWNGIHLPRTTFWNDMSRTIWVAIIETGVLKQPLAQSLSKMWPQLRGLIAQSENELTFSIPPLVRNSRFRDLEPAPASIPSTSITAAPPTLAPPPQTQILESREVSLPPQTHTPPPAYSPAPTEANDAPTSAAASHNSPSTSLTTPLSSRAGHGFFSSPLTPLPNETQASAVTSPVPRRHSRMASTPLLKKAMPDFSNNTDRRESARIRRAINAFYGSRSFTKRLPTSLASRNRRTRKRRRRARDSMDLESEENDFEENNSSDEEEHLTKLSGNTTAHPDAEFYRSIYNREDVKWGSHAAELEITTDNHLDLDTEVPLYDIRAHAMTSWRVRAHTTNQASWMTDVFNNLPEAPLGWTYGKDHPHLFTFRKSGYGTISGTDKNRAFASHHFVLLPDEQSDSLSTRSIVINDEPLQFDNNLLNAISGWNLSKRFEIRDFSFVSPSEDGALRYAPLTTLTKALKEDTGKILHCLSIPNYDFPLRNGPNALSCDHIAWGATTNVSFLGSDPTYPHSVMEWYLAGLNGSYSDFHVDTNGFATRISVLTGKKLWIIAEPKEEEEEPVERASWPAWLEFWRQESLDLSRFRLYPIVMTPGTTLIMRPGTLHAAITLEPTVMSGDHFYHIGSLQDSIWGYYHTFVNSQTLTNTDHSKVAFRAFHKILGLIYIKYIQVNPVTGLHIHDSEWLSDYVPDLSDRWGLWTTIHLCILLNFGGAVYLPAYIPSHPDFDCESRDNIMAARGLVRTVIEWLDRNTELPEQPGSFMAMYNLELVHTATSLENYMNSRDSDLQEQGSELEPIVGLTDFQRNANYAVEGQRGISDMWDLYSGLVEQNAVKWKFGLNLSANVAVKLKPTDQWEQHDLWYSGRSEIEDFPGALSVIPPEAAYVGPLVPAQHEPHTPGGNSTDNDATGEEDTTVEP
ncbi:hypothetical protein NP233_g1025 [Leucocoprinus birnbaumii]|uniref:JmjC domain-containing protein n=1 Tax=Leucocoprinus birnbaumii TaxID=56174 RepID=A0AAD5YZX7_9AGAR|nr:hypothetical protein NP233_g1025 [Leucocoprinus birnbaumii]